MASRQQIKAALERAADTVTRKPSIGQRVYVNTAVVRDGLACRMQEKHYVLAADLPVSMGGEDCGPSPSVLLRAALSSCIAMGVKMWAARQDVAIECVEVRVETDVDARGQFGAAAIAAGFEAIRIKVRVESAADTAAVDAIVQTSLRFSPLMDAIRPTPTVETEIILPRVLEDQ